MKILFVVLVMFVAMNAGGQWQPDVRLTNNSADSYTSWNNGRCIGTNGNVVHVVWYDDRDGNFEIYYKRSSDGGGIWGSDVRLTNSAFDSWYPTIFVLDLIVHVVWHDNRDGNEELYYKKSTDGGVNWGADMRLTNNSGRSRFVSLTATVSVVQVSWEDNRDGNDEIYSKRSTDGGITWGADMRLTNSPADSRNSCISSSGLLVHVAWEDTRDGNSEIYYKRSTDGGVNWGTDTRLTNNPLFSGTPSLAVANSSIHIVYQDNINGNDEVYYKRSTDGGISWGVDTRLTNNSQLSNRPSVTVSDSNVHIVWSDTRDGTNPEIYYKRSTNNGTNWETDERLTNNSSISERPSVAVSGATVHLIWHDNRDGNNEIYYKREINGNPTESHNISTEIPSLYSLSQNYPNPFNPSTNVKFSIVNAEDVKLVVYDIQGREVQTLVNESLKPGTYETTFDGGILNSGVYFYKITAGDFSETKKMILIK